jgi:small conductance mechanosensitive channel
MDGWRALVCASALMVLSAGGSARAQSTSSSTAAPGAGPAAPAPLLNDVHIREQLAQAKRQWEERGPRIEAELGEIAATIQNVDTALRDRPSPELIARREDLDRRKEALEAEQKALKDIVSAWESAASSSLELTRVRKELERFREALEKKEVKFQPGDAAILEIQIRQTRGVLKAQQESAAAWRQRLAEVEERLNAPSVARRAVLSAERQLLRAQVDSMPVRLANNEAKLALHEAKLAAARELGEGAGRAAPPPQSRPATATSTAPESIEALNKQRLATALELEAKDRLAAVRQDIAEALKKRDEALAKGQSTEAIEDDLQFHRQREQYEVRRIRQATLKSREAEQARQIAALERANQEAQARLEALRSGHMRMTPDQRADLADQFREKAQAALEAAAKYDQEAQLALNWIASTRESLALVDAMQKALDQRPLPLTDAFRVFNHVRRMKLLLNTDREQYDQMMTSQTVGYYQQLRQASLSRRLAETYQRMADALAPPPPSFWERHKKIFWAFGVFAFMVVAGYVLKAVVWLTERGATWLKAAVPSYNFSVKRVTTLVSFARSIVQLFVWIFGIITILSEFGIDPAKSSGAIGLVGLIMAGMFQQIVVDFIKGLDIIAGRHYNVGDFVELDGKYGHVIDFNAKYTRIRTLSGQELNIPNSRCIPSRRFPEGYVDNYVDIVLKSGADVGEAKTAIQAVCMYLNRRLEPLKERPLFIDRFRSVGGRAILRYRVRVLPGCDWVVTDYFIPGVRTALEARGIEMEGDPKFFFINRIDTFRKLFSRQLTEQEILQEAAELDAPPVADKPASPAGAGDHDKPALPAERPIEESKAEKPPLPAEAVEAAGR